MKIGKIFTETETTWHRHVQQWARTPGVVIDLKIEEMPDEMQEQIVAAAEDFSDKVGRILEGESTMHNPHDITTSMVHDQNPVKADAPDNDSTSALLDREQRIRMLARAVEGMTYLDWKNASHQISKMFTPATTAASNKAAINKPLEEITDIIVNQRL